MRIEHRAAVTPFDHIIDTTPGGLFVVAVPEHEADAIANLTAGGFDVDLIEYSTRQETGE